MTDLLNTEHVERSRATENNQPTRLLTYREAAETFGTSRSKITRAVKSGALVPESTKRSGRNVWVLELTKLEKWAKSEGLCPAVTTSDYVPTIRDHSPIDREHEPVTTSHDRSYSDVVDDERPDIASNVASELFDRLEAAQRKSVLLELQLQQTQRLLVENNESQHEREARALEAEAKLKEETEQRAMAEDTAATAKEEATKAQAELESLRAEVEKKKAQEQALELMAADLHEARTQLASLEEEKKRPWWRKMFGAKTK